MVRPFCTVIESRAAGKLKEDFVGATDIAPPACKPVYKN
ncbi:hypothetical protein PAMC26510_02980 [Caballeronia sordidicola]|uniref:Uncharacterized protein n=1 Tax=Caballeronia sordidicola TaxID=196367 RepID=A0A242NAB4_CABSO|nr:hypothetical protein PAMC26577_26105 [Caballeronia sordidicola]OTP80587.1 hypothetical protein PAMC26510_02980 [Caballeronia sordidicola]